MTKVVQNKFTSNYKYDGVGNLIQASNSRKDNVSLSYDRFGRILKMINGKGRTITFKYGTNGKPILIKEKGVGTIRIAYDGDGRIQKTETISAGNSRKPSQATSKRVIQQVMRGFQDLLNIIRPAGVNYSKG